MEFVRADRCLSLCGLNCALCTMKLGGYCGGCGNGSRACAISRCSLEHGAPEYCCDCDAYPCEKYEGVDEYDSFITHRRQKSELERIRRIGPGDYAQEQREKVSILSRLLSDFNDGRRKSFYCLAVNLLDLPELRQSMERIEGENLLSLPIKERSAKVAGLLNELADSKGVELKLRRRK